MAKRVTSWVQNKRLALGRAESAPIATLFGALVGALTGLVMVLFRYLVEAPMDGDNEAMFFHSLEAWQRFALPVAGALAIAAFAYCLKPEHRDAGVGHVVERMQRHQGIMKWQNALYQFVGGIIAMATGHSVGREGPAVHIGSALSSWVGTQARLPKNLIRILVACGTAAAISASFNTPIAGVVFAMEVVLLEYTIVGFLPIIMAAVMGSLIHRIFYGDSPAFFVPAQALGELSHLGTFAITGIVIGILAALFIRLRCELCRTSSIELYQRLIIAGLISGIGAMFIPDIMGSGYPQLQQALNLDLSWQLALQLVIAKLFFTAVIVGLGLPGGLIATTFVAGGCVGVVVASMVADASLLSNFVLVGMAAMMGAILNAPLAALLAVLELSHNPHLILPAMLAIVIANNVSRMLNERSDVFRAALHRAGKLDQHSDRYNPLRSVAVSALQSTSFKITSSKLPTSEAEALLAQQPRWLVVRSKNNGFKFALSAADLSRHLAKLNTPDNVDYPNQQIILADIPGEKLDIELIDSNESAAHAMKTLRDQSLGMLVVATRASSPSPAVIGIVTEHHLRNYYFQGI